MPRHGKQRETATALSRELATHLKDAAANQGVDNKRLAELSGLSEPTLTRTFKHGRVLDVVELDAICGALGLVPWKVMREAEEYVKQRPSLSVVEATLEGPDEFALAADRSEEEPEQ